MSVNEAVLLLGPTGSGKTPLGELLAARGLSGRRCLHFDFGAQLRRVAECGGDGLDAETVTFVRRVLRDGMLLEDEHFPVARAILEAFLTQRAAGPRDLVVLNGLPRHAGQARDVASMLDVILLVALECTARTVHARIAGNLGGDRTGRSDDSVAEVGRKLATYAARTRPLLDHYRERGVRCLRVPVAADTAPADVVAALAEAWPLGGS